MVSQGLQEHLLQLSGAKYSLHSDLWSESLASVTLWLAKASEVPRSSVSLIQESLFRCVHDDPTSARMKKCTVWVKSLSVTFPSF